MTSSCTRSSCTGTICSALDLQLFVVEHHGKIIENPAFRFVLRDRWMIIGDDTCWIVNANAGISLPEPGMNAPALELRVPANKLLFVFNILNTEIIILISCIPTRKYLSYKWFFNCFTFFRSISDKNLFKKNLSLS